MILIKVAFTLLALGAILAVPADAVDISVYDNKQCSGGSIGSVSLGSCAKFFAGVLGKRTLANFVPPE